MTREEQWLGAIAGIDGVTPPSMPVWHYEQMLAAIYDAVTGASPAREFPERSWHLDEFLWAVYCAVAGLADPGIPAPTCRIEEFWRGIYLKAMNDEDAAVPTPVWRIEEFLAEVFNNLTTAELKTVTGTMLHVLDALAKPAEELLVSLSPIQDLHGYSSPWPAGGGVNKLDPIAVFGGASSIYEVNADGTITVKSSDSRSWGNVPELQLPAGTYNISKDNATGLSAVRLSTEGYSSDHFFNPDGGYTFTFSEPASIKVKMSYASATYPKTEKPQIVIGQTVPTVWSPYSNICPISGRTGVTVYVSPTQNQADATTYAVDWTSEAGTVYGGTLDVKTGVLTVDRAMVTLNGTQRIAWTNWRATDTSTAWQYGGEVFGEKKVATNERPNIISDSFSTVTYNQTYGGTESNSIAVNSNVNYSIIVRTDDTSLTTEAAINAYLSANPIQMVYELATPLTYQLSAQEAQLLLGENYLWESSGADLSLTYYADGNANTLDALNLMLGNRYVNNHTPEDVSDREALDILLGR